MQVNEEQNVGETVVDRKTERGFTPGPWKVHRAETEDEWNVMTLDGYYVAQAFEMLGVNDREETLANARLIAAAPALYEVALRAADYLCADRPSACSQTRIDTPHCVSCLARAALALVNKPDTNSANSDHPAHGQASKTEVQK